MSTSSLKQNLPQVTFVTALGTLLAAVKANVPVLLLGDPGVGKSALATLVAEQLGLPLATLLGSTVDPTDVGGLPVVRKDGKGVDRVPLQLLRECADKPTLLFLDEASAAPPTVQAAFLRLVLERVAGDLRLHPDTRVILAANPPEQAPGGFELSAPLMGRVCALWLRPSDEEVLSFFTSTLGAEGSDLRAAGADFAATCDVMPELLQVDCPDDCATGGKPWGAPRSWERAIRSLVAADGASDDVRYALLAGSVGPHLAAAYLGVLKMRSELPSVSAILAEPVKADVPSDKRRQIGAIGLVPRVAAGDSWAAWIYASRLAPELGLACAARLLKTRDTATSPHKGAGLKARVALSAKVVR